MAAGASNRAIRRGRAGAVQVARREIVSASHLGRGSILQEGVRQAAGDACGEPVCETSSAVDLQRLRVRHQLQGEHSAFSLQITSRCSCASRVRPDQDCVFCTDLPSPSDTGRRRAQRASGLARGARSCPSRVGMGGQGVGAAASCARSGRKQQLTIELPKDHQRDIRRTLRIQHASPRSGASPNIGTRPRGSMDAITAHGVPARKSPKAMKALSTQIAQGRSPAVQAHDPAQR